MLDSARPDWIAKTSSSSRSLMPLKFVVSATRSISSRNNWNSASRFFRSLEVELADAAWAARLRIRSIMSLTWFRAPSAVCSMWMLCWMLRLPSLRARTSENRVSAIARLDGSSLERLTRLPEASCSTCLAARSKWTAMLGVMRCRLPLCVMRTGI